VNLHALGQQVGGRLVAGLVDQREDAACRLGHGFLAGEQLDQLVQGLYLGVMLGMLAYNFFLWRVMRERVYLWYVLWVAAIASFQSADLPAGASSAGRRRIFLKLHAPHT